MNKVKANGITTLYLEGMLNTGNSGDLEQEFCHIVADRDDHIVINMRDLKLITSSGLRVFLSFAKKLKQFHGKLILCEMSSDVQEIFTMTGFSSIFTICMSAEDAQFALAA